MAPDPEDLGGERLASVEEVGALDEREAGIVVDPACQQRGDGEEELVDQALGEQRAPRWGRPRKHEGMAAFVDEGEIVLPLRTSSATTIRSGGRASRPAPSSVVKTTAPEAKAG